MKIAERARRLALALITMGHAASTLAAELPIADVYGNAIGCAIARRVPNAPQGIGTAIAKDYVIHKRERCDITSVVNDPAGAGWRVGISCAAGHDGETAAALGLAREANNAALLVTLFSGDGPSGRLALCPAP
jgi:hypothetical protein